jgi:hypothetical protein
MRSLAVSFFQLGYVSNSNSFPQAAHAEEEQKYIEAYKKAAKMPRNTLY